MLVSCLFNGIDELFNSIIVGRKDYMNMDAHHCSIWIEPSRLSSSCWIALNQRLWEHYHFSCLVLSQGERERERERESNLKSRILSFCHTPACIFGYQRIFFIIIWMCSHRYFSYWNIFFREILSNNRSLVLYICFVDCCLFLCTISLGHCVVCSSSMYGFWLPLWYLLAIALSVLLRCTDSDCPLGIFKLFLLNIH